MDSIRITMTKGMEQVISELEKKMQPLDRAEIVKAALADLYRKMKMEERVEYFSAIEERELKRSLASEKSAVLRSAKDIKEYFHSLDT